MADDQVHARDWRAHFTSPFKAKMLRESSAPNPTTSASTPSPALPRLTTLGPPQTPPMLSKEYKILGISSMPMPPPFRDNIPSSIYSVQGPRTPSPASTRSRRSSSGSLRSTPASSVTSASDYLGHQANNPWIEDDGARASNGWFPPKRSYTPPMNTQQPVTQPEPRRSSNLRAPSPPQASHQPLTGDSPSLYASSPPSSTSNSPLVLPQSRFEQPSPPAPIRATKPTSSAVLDNNMDHPAFRNLPKPLKPSPLQISNRVATTPGLQTARPLSPAMTPPPRSVARLSPDTKTPVLPTSRYNAAAPAPVFTPRHTPKCSNSDFSMAASAAPAHAPMMPLTPPIMEPEDVPISQAEIGTLWCHASLLYHNKRTSDALNTFHDLQKRRGVPRETLTRLTLNVGIISTQLARRATTMAHPTSGSNDPTLQTYHLATEAFHSAINSHPGGCIGVAGTFYLGCALFDAGQHAKAADCFDMCEGVFVNEGWAAEESHRFTPVDEEVDLRRIGLDYTLRLQTVRANWRVCQERVRIPMGLGTNRHLERIPETLLLETQEDVRSAAAVQNQDSTTAEEGELVFMAFDTSNLASSPTTFSHPIAHNYPPTPPIVAPPPNKHTYSHSHTFPQPRRPTSPVLAPLNTNFHTHATSLPTFPVNVRTPPSATSPQYLSPVTAERMSPTSGFVPNSQSKPISAPPRPNQPAPKLPPGFHRPEITHALRTDATRRENAAEMRERERKKQARETRMLIRLGDLRLNKPLPPLPSVPLGYRRPGDVVPKIPRMGAVGMSSGSEVGPKSAAGKAMAMEMGWL